jgi:hypothetical protein
MFKFTFSLVCVGMLFLASCITEDDKTTQIEKDAAAAAALTDSANFTTIQWIDSVKNFGNIMEGQKLEVVFRLKNTGTKPLVIESVKPSCGCTVPQKPEEPVMPGAEASIKAIFDSEGRTGTNHKTLTVTANTSGGQQHTLEFNVEVIGAKDGPKPTDAQPVKTPLQ